MELAIVYFPEFFLGMICMGIKPLSAIESLYFLFQVPVLLDSFSAVGGLRPPDTDIYHLIWTLRLWCFLKKPTISILGSLPALANRVNPDWIVAKRLIHILQEIDCYLVRHRNVLNHILLVGSTFVKRMIHNPGMHEIVENIARDAVEGRDKLPNSV